MPNAVVCSNGDVVRLAPGPASVVDEVPQGRLYKDGRLIIDGESRTVADRRRLSFVGVVSVAAALDDAGGLVGDPAIELIGIPETDADGASFHDIAFDAVVDTIKQLPRARRRDPDAVAEAVKRAVRSAVASNWGKKPLCLVHILTI